VRRIVSVCLAALVMVSCSKSDQPAMPTAPTPQSLYVASLRFEPRALNGGDSSHASLTLNLPSPTPTRIALSSNASAAVVPASVTVPAGSTSAGFVMTTEPVTENTVANITALVGGRETRLQLYVWPVAENSIWYESTPMEFLGGAGAGRLDVATARMQATCDQNALYSQIYGPSESWMADFYVPRGLPMTPGTYSFSGPRDPSRPFLLLIGRGHACFASGEFTIETAELNPSGAVERFVATFTQRCQDQGAVIRGEIRLANVPRGAGGATPSRCTR